MAHSGELRPWNEWVRLFRTGIFLVNRIIRGLLYGDRALKVFKSGFSATGTVRNFGRVSGRVARSAIFEAVFRVELIFVNEDFFSVYTLQGLYLYFLSVLYG